MKLGPGSKFIELLSRNILQQFKQYDLLAGKQDLSVLSKILCS